MDFAKIKRKRKNIFLGKLSFWLSVFIGLLIFVGLIIFYFINQKDKGRFNLVIVNNPLVLISLEREREEAIIVTIPGDVYIESSRGKGKVKADSLFKLDSVSGIKGKLFRESLREFLGMPIDGFLKTDTNFNFDNIDDFIKFKNEISILSLENPFRFLYSSAKTNLFFLSLEKFLFQLNKVRTDKITFIDLYKENLFTKEELADGSQVLNIDKSILDGTIKNSFYEWVILKEDLSISVLNGSNGSGLATSAYRIITNSGGKVIVVSESPVKTDKCVIEVNNNNKNTYTVKRYKDIFNCNINTIEQNGRTDITITVGSEYKEQVLGK